MSRPSETPRRTCLGAEILFDLLVILMVIGLPYAIFRHDARLAQAEPGRVINIVGRNDRDPEKPGRWLVQEGAGWTFGNEAAPSVIRVKRGEVVTLRLISADSFHEFSLPAYGIKATVYPGDLTKVTFAASQAGEFPFLCTAYCDVGHWQMIGKLIVEEPTAPSTAGGSGWRQATGGGG